ncbi:MAG: S8 family serine peptidase [Candidatus Xenobiia bacterium LiM19]
MSAAIGGNGPEYFSFNQLQNITKIMETADFKGAKVEKEAEKPGETDTMDVIIISRPGTFKGPEPDAAQVERNLEGKGVGIEKKLDLISGVSARIKPEQAEELKNEGYIVFDNSRRSLMPAMPRATAVPRESQSGKPWDMPRIDYVKMTGDDALLAKGYDGDNQTWAVVDSGFKKDNYKLKEWHSVLGINNPNDAVGHGTDCAGIIHEVSPKAELVAVQVMQPDGSGRPSDIVEGIDWVVANRERLGITGMNLSLGGAPDDYPYYFDPIDMAVEKAWEKGIVVVSAAGNSGPGEHTIGSPADDPMAMAVGAALNPGKVSDFSSRGPTDDKGVVKPDIMAPGEYVSGWNVPDSQMGKTAAVCETIRKMTPEQITQLLINKPDLIEAFNLPEDILEKPAQEIELMVKTSLPPMYLPDSEHIAGPGTSFAAPIISGIAANLREEAPGANPDDIKNVIMDTADSMGQIYGKYDQGRGFVNAKRAGEKLKA